MALEDNRRGVWIGMLALSAALALSGCIPGEEPGGGTGDPCGSLGNGPCGDGEYCKFPVGALCGRADAPGVCEAVPRACTREYAPVCGCDGVTYGNACTAAAAGVSVESQGECAGGDAGTPDGGTGAFCGGFAGVQCEEGSYCSYPPSTRCGSGDQGGTCEVIPDVCPLNLDPVCGCDGNTYGNACQAASQGVSVASDGACEEEAASCGGLIGAPCPDEQFCNYPEGALCGAADAPGVCTTPPEVCTAIYDPVCGCDGNTYASACVAAGARVSVLHDGEC